MAISPLTTKKCVEQSGKEARTLVHELIPVRSRRSRILVVPVGVTAQGVRFLGRSAQVQVYRRRLVRTPVPAATPRWRWEPGAGGLGLCEPRRVPNSLPEAR